MDNLKYVNNIYYKYYNYIYKNKYLIKKIGRIKSTT